MDYRKSYNKALKKLAGQISRTIRPNVTYRNIPFGFSQLDIHTDGMNTLLAVKVFEKEKEMRVSEFHIHSSNLRKFLISDEMMEIFNPADTDHVEILMEDYVFKPISQGIAQIVYDSKDKKEYWVFPFYKNAISFEKVLFAFNSKKSADSLVGNVFMIKLGKNEKYRTASYTVNGFAADDNIHDCLEYWVFTALTKPFLSCVFSDSAYLDIDEKIKKISVIAS